MGNIVGKRLRKAREKAGLRRSQVSERTNINYKTLSGYENGVSQPDLDTLKILANLYIVSVDWLLGEDIKNELPIDLLDVLENERQLVVVDNQPLTPKQRLGIIRVIENPDITKQAPVIGDIKSGYDFLAQENHRGYLEFPGDMNADFAMDVIGASMTGVGILEGDYILFKKADTAQPGEIVAAIYETSGEPEATLKYFFIDKEKGPVLRPASPNAQDLVPENGFRIVGIMVGLLRKFAPPYRLYNSYLAARDVNKSKWDPVIERAFQIGIKPEQVMAVIDMIRQVK